MGETTNLPFSFLRKQNGESPISGATISFHSNKDFEIHFKKFVIQDGALSVAKTPVAAIDDPIIRLSPQYQFVPIFSIIAIILLILVRNLFYGSFQKYFFSPIHNYEIDFNFQKIGIIPILFAIFINLFSLSDMVHLIMNPTQEGGLLILKNLGLVGKMLATPLLFSVIIMFLLNFSFRFFPVLFSDIKTLFWLSLIALVWNFLTFGIQPIQFFDSKQFLFTFGLLFFLFRSFFLLQIFQKAYRFRLPVTLFYICTLNLGTFLLLFQGLSPFLIDIYE